MELEMVHHGVCMSHGLCTDDGNDDTVTFDLNLCYSYPCFSQLGNSPSLRLDLDASRISKRPKMAPDFYESIGSKLDFHGSSNNSRNSKSLTNIPRVPFREYVWAYAERYLAIEAMQESAAEQMGGQKTDVKEEGNSDQMKLVHQLIACAEAVAYRDKTHASVLLSELRANALVFGTSFQRVASCFVQGLTDRFALVQPLGAVGVQGSTGQSVDGNSEKDEALSLVYEICPQIQFGHLVANVQILEAIEGESSVHVVDLGMSLGLPHGQQWKNLMHSLANRAGKPPCCLRITGIGNSAMRLKTIGDELKLYARNLGLKFEFLSINSSLESLSVEDFNIVDAEAVIVNSILQLHCAVKESRGALNSVLQVLQQLSPRLFILVEQDSSHNGPFFLGRFMEALHYYSAIFDSLDAMLPKYDTKRAKIEQFFFAQEIKNIVSCEGQARIERHERNDQWRRRMSRAGFQVAPINMILQAKQWLAKFKVFDGYTVVEEKGCLVLGWKSKPITAASCWKCS
ncbi:hypothetical protein K2173_002665 [Erythroxylum novogranatense]|uniref:DELLA protein RGL1 n=1 Tax=Erythroxylum novogranatense TaxID=1862640 RepID=A0AAV8SWP8_9ROSI|nr:hypothetical protein K2173_002665 [Erythroxylum novogranatense]